MNSAWSLEVIRIIALLCSAVIFGYVSGYWGTSFLLHFIIYVIWNMFQIRNMERWISRGAHRSDAPNGTGIWQQMVQHLYRSQRSHKARKKQLANLANYYHAVMRALPDATIVVNKNLEIEWANKASQKLLGVKPNKDVGHRIDNIIRIPEVVALFDEKAKLNRIQVDSPIDTDITLSISKQEYEEGNYLILAQDISHRVATQKLRKAFIANASHELRTPLTVISGYLEILQDEEHLPADVVTVLDNAYEQATRMDNILDDLLVLSKLEEAHTNKSAGKKVDVGTVIEQVVADFKVSYADKGHKFKVKADDVKLRVIEGELVSICQNLISNAVKYSNNNSLIKITWSVDHDGQGCLCVIDQGNGIPDEHLSRLTERFYRVDPHTVKGTGLGLSIVKHILDNHDGYLDISSEVGKGSCFRAVFPAYRLKK